VGKKTGTRHSPPVVNAAYFNVQFWDGRAPNLETQAEGPCKIRWKWPTRCKRSSKDSMPMPAIANNSPPLGAPTPITYEMVEKSIASFERTVISGNSPFDRWKYGHDNKAVSAAVKRGFLVFTSKKKADCASCHTVGEKYALFTDNQFHNVGVGVNAGEFTDVGLYAVTRNEADKAKFKTPSLRNIALTAPYMSNGSLTDLKQVIDFYIGAGNSNPNLDPKIHVLDFLTGQERSDLQAFLNSLTGEIPPAVGPPEVLQT
jgi:cytochrome c peroxidase